MRWSEKIEYAFKAFMYEKGRNKKDNIGINKDKFFGNLLDALDEIETYIDEKTQVYQQSKKNTRHKF